MPGLLALVGLLALLPRWGHGEELRPPRAALPPFPESSLTSRKRQFLEMAASKATLPRDSAVLAPTCVRLPTLSDFFPSSAVERGTASVPKIQALLARPAARLHEVFEVLKATRWGRAVLAKFLPRYGFEIKIEHFTDAMREEERAGGRLAAALYSPMRRTIYIDRSQPVGFVAPILLHEIVHSLDQDAARAAEGETALWKVLAEALDAEIDDAAEKGDKGVDQVTLRDLSPTQISRLGQARLALAQYRDVRIYRMERVAYDVYKQVLRDLSALFPAYYGPRLAAGWDQAYGDDALARAENLDPATIARYRAGLCRTQ